MNRSNGCRVTRVHKYFGTRRKFRLGLDVPIPCRDPSTRQDGYIEYEMVRISAAVLESQCPHEIECPTGIHEPEGLDNPRPCSCTSTGHDGFIELEIEQVDPAVGELQCQQFERRDGWTAGDYIIFPSLNIKVVWDNKVSDWSPHLGLKLCITVFD